MSHHNLPVKTLRQIMSHILKLGNIHLLYALFEKEHDKIIQWGRILKKIISTRTLLKDYRKRSSHSGRINFSILEFSNLKE